MLSAIKHKLLTLLQLLLVITYIISEEIIWDGIARPIYSWVHSLQALQKVERWLGDINASVILVIFVLMLASVELLGIYAGVLFVSGKMAFGVALYLTKIPIAAFTFWMFRVTESKLMQFGWFKWIYEKIMAVIDWLKSLEVYQSTIFKLKEIKKKIKTFWKTVKAKYFSKGSPFATRLKKLYNSVKQAMKK
ncbi:MAG: hypothetical protein P794_04330 [Epsilonproteobacteria bacterium (ex Lamellibrachia satsuma)]|nr:MAG: hypothetical protein P794_04330 [Epsilonproteobacteria bacterium (ex Lamellibrachia satsuma)]